MELEQRKKEALQAAQDLRRSGNDGTASFFEWLANPDSEERTNENDNS